MKSERPPARALREQSGQRTVVGATITIKGEVSGGQDLLVLGRIEGRISLPGCNITVGQGAWVKANLVGKRIRVDGAVEGHLQGEEKIHVTGCVQGDLFAPQLVLENGCRYRGTVDTGV
ncbi:MAG: polymer-forming cytoskeletal protein [Acidobacteriota bacterium]|nr:polymer-forming cytoskeletal protein [Acidobacteriota bacterium]